MKLKHLLVLTTSTGLAAIIVGCALVENPDSKASTGGGATYQPNIRIPLQTNALAKTMTASFSGTSFPGPIPTMKSKADAAFPLHVIVKSGEPFELEAPKFSGPGHGNPNKPIKYQWRREDVDLLNETNATLPLGIVTHAQAGTYSVIFKESEETESAPVYVSVISYFTNQSNGGYLSIPLTSFSTLNYTVCSGAGFNKYKAYYPFPGSVFPNTSGETNLIVDTCTNLNGTTLDTGIRILENFGDMLQLACNNDTNCGVGNPLLSSCTLTGLLAGQTYRVGIHYKTNTIGTAPSVTFRWKYSNAFSW